MGEAPMLRMPRRRAGCPWYGKIKSGRGISGGPVLRHFLAEEGDAGSELFEAVDAVFDADPAGEVDGFQFGEDGVVVVEALAYLAVAQALGVADGVGFF